MEHIQALHAAISRRDWHAVEIAANSLRDATPANSRAEAIGAALDHAISTLEGLSHIYDGNPSLAMADMPEVEYARHMLGEARKEAREAVKHCRALLQQEGE